MVTLERTLALAFALSAVASCQAIVGIDDSTLAPPRDAGLDQEAPDAGVDAAADAEGPRDAGSDAAPDVASDGSSDASPDAARDAAADAPSDGARDASPDAPPPGDGGDAAVLAPPQVVTVDVPAILEVASSSKVHVTGKTAPGESLAFVITAAVGGGSFAPAGGNATADGAGNVAFDLTFSAPGSKGVFTHSVRLTDRLSQTHSRNFDTQVLAFVQLGYPSAFAATTTGKVAPNFLSAIPVTLQAGTVMRLGLLAKSAGAQVKLGLYADAGGVPGALVAGTSAAAVPSGRLELPVTPAAISAGTYWMAGLYDADADISQSSGSSPPQVGFKYTALTFASQLPSTFPASPSNFTAGPLNYYAVVAN